MSTCFNCPQVPSYNMYHIPRSQTVRSHWGVLMRSGTAKRDFAEIQINNVVTLATRVRIQLLKVIYLV